MVTVAQYQQQLTERQRQIEEAKARVEAYPARQVIAPKRGLLSGVGGILGRLGLRRQQAAQIAAQQQALQQIGLAEAEQRRLETAAAPAFERYKQAMEKIQQYETGRKAAEKGHAWAYFQLSREGRRGYREAMEGIKAAKAREQYMKDVRGFTGEVETTLGFTPGSLTFEQAKMYAEGTVVTPEGQFMSMDPSLLEQMPDVPEIPLAPPTLPGVPTQKVSDFMKGYETAPVPLPYEQRWTVGPVAPTYVPTIKKPGPWALPRAIRERIVTIGEKVPEWIGKQYERMPIPTARAEILQAGRRVGRGVSPVYPPTEVEIVSPELVGKRVRQTWRYGQYAVPGWGPALFGAEVWKTAEVPIPTVKEILAEQKPPELSKSEWEGYLKTPEGKAYEKEVETYVSETRRAKYLGLGLAATALAAYPAYRLTKYGLQKVRAPITPPPKPVTRTLGLEVYGAEKDVWGGVQRVVTKRPPWPGVEYRRYEELLAKIRKKPYMKEIKYEPPFVQVVDIPFLATETQLRGIGTGLRKRVRQRVVPPFEVKVESMPFNLQQWNQLSKEYQYTLRRLAESAAGRRLTTPEVLRILSQRQDYFMTRGALMPGWPAGRPDVRFMKPGEYFVRKRPFTIAEIERQIGIARVKPAKVPSGVLAYDVETAAKRVVSLFPRAAGKVDITKGRVFVLPGEAPPTTIAGRKLKLKLTTKQKTALVAKTTQVEKIVSKRYSPIKIKPEPVVTLAPPSPVATPSIYAGLGLYERTEAFAPALLPKAPVTRLITPPIVKPVEKLAITPLSLERTGLKLGQMGALKERAIQIPAFVPAVAPVTRARIIPRERAVVTPAFVLKVKQPLIMKPRVTPRVFPRVVPRVTPKPRLRPRPPKIPLIIPKEEMVKKPIVKRKRLPWEFAFIPLVRRRGVFRPVAPPLPRAKALAIGAKIARETAAVTFKVVPTKKMIKPTREKFVPSPKIFRPYRIVKGKKVPLAPGEFIQRRRYRIAAPGELREITFAGIRARRKKRGEPKWF